MGFLFSSARETEKSLEGEAATLHQSPPIVFLHFRRTDLPILSSTLLGLFHPNNTHELQPSGHTPLESPILSPVPILPCRFLFTGFHPHKQARLRRLDPLVRPSWTPVAKSPRHSPPGIHLPLWGFLLSRMRSRLLEISSYALSLVEEPRLSFQVGTLKYQQTRELASAIFAPKKV